MSKKYHSSRLFVSTSTKPEELEEVYVSLSARVKGYTRVYLDPKEKEGCPYISRSSDITRSSGQYWYRYVGPEGGVRSISKEVYDTKMHEQRSDWGIITRVECSGTVASDSVRDQVYNADYFVYNEPAGLRLLKVYFRNEQESRMYRPLMSYGSIEVTGDPRYEIKSLAEFGMPK